MANTPIKWLALLGSALIGAASAAYAQDSGPLIDLLVKKGIVNDQEAETLRAELARDSSSAVVSTLSGGKSTVGLSISGRVQVQYANIGGKIDGSATDLTATNHFFLRRVYLGAKATLPSGWSANFNYDFANSSFDAAFIEWRANDAFFVDAGFRKVPFGLEEYMTSSSNLRAIERSPADRFFVESNNGRRLGAGSYRTGVFIGGKLDSGVYYNAAVTNPERDESATSATGVSTTGMAANNNLSYWGNVGYTSKVAESWTYNVGAAAGFLPDQGGKTLGAGDNLTVYDAYVEVSNGSFDLQAEYFGSNNEHGVSATKNSSSWGYYVQPAYKFTEKIEGVVRYSYIDSDGRGVTTSDGIRSAPSGGTMDKLSEWFIGGNYYIRGNDVKLQLGYIYGESKDTVTGGKAKASIDGVRTQLQVNF